jgi:uncharacterized damage-inducible protein DinB
MDAADREKNIAMLVKGREALLHAVAGVSEEQARTRPTPVRWSVLECVEHIVLAEKTMFELLTTKSAPAASPLGSSREERIFNGATDRSREFEAPEFARPTGRFPSLSAALDEFSRWRARAISYVELCDSDLRSRTSTHPALGPVSCQELLIILALHPSRHAEQIREARKCLGLE